MILLGKILGGSKPQTQQEKTNQAYAQYAGTRMASTGTYQSTKSPLQKMQDDFLMDIGSKPKDADYYARLDERTRRSKEAVASANRGSGGSAAPAGPTPEELEAQRKAAALAKRKEEGQKVRKEYEKKKGTLVLAQRKKYTAMLNV